MKSFKQFIVEGKKSKLRDTLASAMLTGGLLNSTGIPIQSIPGIVHDYWREKIAPTPRQQLIALSKKYEKSATRDKKGQRVLNIDAIPDENDRSRFQRLITRGE